MLFSGVASAAAPDKTAVRSVRIGVVNNSSISIDQFIIDAIQRQLNEHILPVWRVTADLYLSAPDDGSSPDYTCQIFDETDIPGNMGYHGVDDSGCPFAKVFPATIARAGLELSTMLSHEIVEMIVDPWGNRSVLYDCGDSTGALYAMEVCDPVQGNTYQIDGVTVSDFVTPQYFQRSAKAPFDFLGILQAPFTPAPSGSQKLMLVGQLGTWL